MIVTGFLITNLKLVSNQRDSDYITQFTRHLFKDSFLDGLDKRYRLHKWLGIVAFVAAVAHWLIKTGSNVVRSEWHCIKDFLLNRGSRLQPGKTVQ